MGSYYCKSHYSCNIGIDLGYNPSSILIILWLKKNKKLNPS